MNNKSDRESIIETKLTKLLESGIDTEEKTLYLLAEIRKVRNKQSEDKTILDLYADWVLHIELNSSNFHHKLLHKIDASIEEGMCLEDIKNTIYNADSDFFKLKDLKNELEKFLKNRLLSYDLTNNNKNWRLFVKNLLEILKEGSLKPKTENIREMSIEEDDAGNTSYKFHIKGHSTKVLVKLKWRGTTNQS